MRPLLLTLVALCACAAAAPAADARGPARAVLVSCDRTHQSAVFEGRMGTPPPATRLQMRFVLQVAAPGEGFGRVAVPGFSAWKTADPGRSGYRYTKRVQGLVGPAAYRVVVRFRWLDGDGAVLHRARRVSRACRQPDRRPDLEVTDLEVLAAARPDGGRYEVTVANTGRTEAAASLLTLSLGDGEAPLSADVDALAPGARQTVVLTGPTCTEGATLTATADADDAVDEHDEDDDVLVASCPATAGP